MPAYHGAVRGGVDGTLGSEPEEDRFWQHRRVSTGVAVTILALVTLTIGASAVRRVQPHQAYVVELLGRYRRTLGPGIHLLVPFLESVRAKVDMAEQVARFVPQPAITSDNLVACVSTVLHYRVVDPVRATYEIADYRRALEMLTITILRNLMGSMSLERARTSPEETTSQLAEALDDGTGSWGLEVTRTEIDSIGTGSRRGCT